LRNLKGTLDIYNLEAAEKINTLNNIVYFDLTEVVVEDKLNEVAIICGRVIVENGKKIKSLVDLYKLSDLSKPVKSMSISLCDRMKIKISPEKKYALIQSISDETSNSSYYGESSLYYMDLVFGKFNKLTLAEGPIHDFEWTPTGY
jgi:hypothetical protein